MSLLCGWLPDDPREAAGPIAAAMLRALRVAPAQVATLSALPGIAVGQLEPPIAGVDGSDAYRPVAGAQGRYHLWMAGEAFHGAGLIDVRDAEATRGEPFRRALTAALLADGIDALRHLDGEYQIALWDAEARILTLANDRFGGLPLYWARSPRGFAFAGGVRGVLMAPEVAPDPDAEALREAVSFGAYRLGDRSYVASVKLVPGAAVMTVAGGRPSLRRYWTWRDLRAVPRRPTAALVEQGGALFSRAVRRQLAGSVRPGQTLSGGLDSRAILAEATTHAPVWTAITYGIPGCDDASYARRAAQAAGARWMLYPLYQGDWLARRTAHIQHTDGLIDLVDLSYLEPLGVEAQHMDVHLSGYIGDAVCGPTFNSIRTTEDLLAALPYYGTSLGYPIEAARERAAALLDSLGGAPARFVLFEHKLPQVTNRGPTACRPWFRMRKPFTSYELFDFWQGLPSSVRGEGDLYARMLVARYPSLFRRIPNQKTGVPARTPRWRFQAARAGRFAWRKLQPLLARAGLPARPRLRDYRAEDAAWRSPSQRARIESVLLGRDSLIGEILDRKQIASLVADWFDRSEAPLQVLAALFVFERYHRDLPAFLREHRG